MIDEGFERELPDIPCAEDIEYGPIMRDDKEVSR